MKKTTQLLLLFLTALTLTACGTKTAQENVIEVKEIVDTVATEEVTTAEAQSEASTPLEGNVEIMLSDKLDGILSEYCLDIAGGNQNVDPANGLQAHTCYSYKGELGTDQVFNAGEFVNDSLSMPVYEVCASVSSLEAGSEISLSACGAEATPIAFSGSGTITPIEAPELCFTAGAESRFGRGSQHQIRDLSLELCSEDKAAYQTWEARAITE